MKIKLIAKVKDVILGYMFDSDTEITIGREIGNTIAPIIDSISRHHARIYFADGAWMVEDLGSTNGSLINGQKIESPVALKNGDSLRFGLIDMSVTIAAAAGAAARPAPKPEPAPALSPVAPAPKPAPALSPVAPAPKPAPALSPVAPAPKPAPALSPIAPAAKVAPVEMEPIAELEPIADLEPVAPAEAASPLSPASPIVGGIKRPTLPTKLKLPPRPALKLPPRKA